MDRTSRTVLLGIALALLPAALGGAKAAEANDLVMAKAGSLPILLTIPHGGSSAVRDVPLRTRGTTSTDGYTLELGEALAKQLAGSLGGEPYIVAARFSRKYIDANRAEAEAFESPRAKPVYDAYHGSIRAFIARMRERYPRGAVLLDLHGQSTDPLVVHRGTRDGATVAALMRKHGPEALTGPDSILGVVQQRGVKVFPSGAKVGEPREDPRYRGGYTVHSYSRAYGLDAIQIEAGRDLRRDPAFIAALGEGIIRFYKAYLR